MDHNEYLCVAGHEAWEVPRPQATTYRDPADWFVEAMTRSSGDVIVNEETILTHGPIWRAVNLLAGDIGQLPVHVMRRSETTTEKDRTHPASVLLRRQPNPWQTPSVWKETMMHWALVYGNAVAWVHRDGANRPIALVPWHPSRVLLDLDPSTGFLTFELYDENRRLVTTLTNEDAIHITGLRSDGVRGLSLVEVAKKDIGLGIQLRDHGYNHFKNGAKPGGVLQHPGRLDADARTNIRDEWNKVHSGAANTGKIAVLWEDMKYNPIPISNDDSQWLDSRKFDRETVANLFGIPAFKLNELENSAVRANLEEQNRDYYQTSLSRWTNRFKEEFDCKLLTKPQKVRETHYFRWFPEAFLRGDTKSRYESYSLAITSQFMSPNEVREREDLNPYPGGDEFRNPAINPQESQQDAPNEDADEPQDVTNRAFRELIRDQCEYFLKAESRSIRQASKHERNFVAWLDTFYGTHLLPMGQRILSTSVAAVSAAGIPVASLANVIEVHGRQSKEQLLGIAGSSSQATLPENVAALVDAWPEDADTLTETILEV